MVFPVSKFQSLLLRPPTPPKDLHDPNHDSDADDVADFLSDPFGTADPIAAVSLAKSSLNTPQTSPSSDSALPSSSAARRKRVNFEAQPCPIPSSGLAAHSPSLLCSSPLKPLPQTRVSKPLKSILKPTDGTTTSSSADKAAPAHTFKSFADMLESIMKQLASPNRSSRVDAYHSLHRTLQAYENIPDTQALVDKMTLLAQFVRRDVLATGLNGSGLDSQLVTQALKLLMALVRIPEIRGAMDDDFCAFIIDRSVQVASDETMSKAIINTHLAMIMQQSFRPRTMNAARVESILDALDSIQARVSGFSVLAYRTRIYKKLIHQKPDVMLKHTDRWLKHTIKALITAQKDINQSALDAVMAAARSFGADRHMTRALLRILNRQKDNGETYAKLVGQVLEKMLNSEHAALVPQIWSVLTCMMHGALRPEEFPALKDWLLVFEKCLHSNKDVVKTHANIAFGFLVYAADVREDTTRDWIKMLAKVPQHQLLQRSQWRKTEREGASSAYFMLLYYALSPLASHAQLARYWQELVADFWSPLLHASTAMPAVAACRVVSALLDGSRRPWESQRALDLRPQAMMQRTELPSLDPKWVRKSLVVILNFVETLLDAAPWLADDSTIEPSKTMWLALLQALKAASSQEVMVSTDAKDAMAHIVNVLRRIWDSHTAQLALSQQNEDSWADKYSFLLTSLVEQLGPTMFSDKFLMLSGKNGSEVACTPSSRSSQRPRTSPLLYFLELLLNQSEGNLSDSVRVQISKTLVESCSGAQNTRLGRLEVLRDCCILLNPSGGGLVAAEHWAHIADIATDCTQSQTWAANERPMPQAGREYDLLLNILCAGLPHSDKSLVVAKLLKHLLVNIRQETGEAAVVHGAIEGVSREVVTDFANDHTMTALSLVAILLRNLPKHIIRRNLEQTRQQLWPQSAPIERTSEFDPYFHLYDAILATGFAAYRNIEITDVETTQDFLSAFADSIRTCAGALLAVYLRKVQSLVQLWVADEEKKLEKKDTASRALQGSVVRVWKDVCAAIERLPLKDDHALIQLQPLWTGALSSRRRVIVNTAVATWNVTFGRKANLRYPPDLRRALLRLRSTVELSLPSITDNEHVPDDALSFYDSEDEDLIHKPALTSSRIQESPFRMTRSSPVANRTSTSRGGSSKRSSSRLQARVRLRHDNSQIVFESIQTTNNDTYNQESQILTERQLEMAERQLATTTMFPHVGSASSPNTPRSLESVRPSFEIHSDALSLDSLQAGKSNTPRSALPPVEDMDVFLGSSPTPHARNRSQQIDEIPRSLATPTRSRMALLSRNSDELGSSPPRPDGLAVVNDKTGLDFNLDGQAEDEAAEQELEAPEPVSTSYDDGTTIEEDIFNAVVLNEQAVDVVDKPQSNASNDLADTHEQIDAQMAAEMQVLEEVVVAQDIGPVATEMDSSSQGVQVPSGSHEAETEVAHSQLETAYVQEPVDDAESSGISRIGDSFPSPEPARTNSPNLPVRRSTRNSATPKSSPGKIRKNQRQVTGRKPGRPRKLDAASLDDAMLQASQEEEFYEDDIQDNIVLEQPQSASTRSSKRRPSGSQQREVKHVLVPDTSRKRGLRRSASQLSQVETHSEEPVVEDAPAFKRPRRSLQEDVSKVQVRRLSHVRASSLHATEQSVSQAPVGSLGTSSGGEAAGSQQNMKTGAPFEQARSLTSTPRRAKEAADRDVSQQENSQVSLTPSRSLTERIILTPRSILNQLKSLKEALFGASQLVLGRQEEREIDDALFDIRREVHAAGKRGDGEGR